MMQDNFTADRIAKAKCQLGKQQTIHRDGKTPGLGLRVTANGAKSYIFETRLHSKTLRLTIGDPRTWSIKKAQDEATRFKALTDQGIDPREQAEEQAEKAEERRKEAKRATLTVSEAWDAYIKARSPKWSARHLADHNYIANVGKKYTKRGDKLITPGALAKLMPLNLSEINAERITSWLSDEVVRRPTQASLAFRLMRAFLNWCADKPEYRGIAAVDACKKSIAKDALPKKVAKTDCLQREQLKEWFIAVRKTANPVIAAYLQTLLLIGSRREELAWLKWTDVDFRWKAMSIHDKVEGSRTIPLTPYVASLLSALPRRNKWVFSSPTAESGRLQDPSIYHRKACAVAGIEGLTLHGLRRSFGTLTEWVECPAGIVAQIMGHKPSATAEKHYKVRPLDLLRVWHTKLEAWILEQAEIHFTQESPNVHVASIK